MSTFVSRKVQATLLSATVFATSLCAQAADGTWNQLSGGSASGTWSDATTSTWLNGIVADGSGSTAYFDTLNITATSTITLGQPRTIGNIVFGDTDTTTAGVSWNLNGTGTNILTLAGTTPTITTATLASSSLVTIGAQIDGTQGLTKAGPSILALSGANIYTGGTTISAGSIRALNNTALGSDAITVASGARLQLGTVSLANDIYLNGTNALYRNTGNNTLSGTVTLQSNSTFSSNSGTNGFVDITGTLALGANTLAVTTSNAGPLNLKGSITGSGGLTKSLDGTLLITNDQTSTYSGTTTINRGVLSLGDDGALGSGTFAFATSNDTYGQIQSSSSAARTIANQLTFGGGNANARYLFGATTTGTGSLRFTDSLISLGTTTRKFEIYVPTQFDGELSGTAGITMQTGTNKLTLAGVNSYTGATTVNAGTLVITGTLASPVTVNGGTLAGTGRLNGPVTITSGALAPGQSAGSLTIDNTLTLAGNANFELGASLSDHVDVNTLADASGKLLTFGGILNVTEASGDLPAYAPGQVYDLFDWGANTTVSGTFSLVNLPTLSGPLTWKNYGTEAAPVYFDYATGQIQVVAIPEPAVLTGIAALASLSLLRRPRAPKPSPM